MRNTQTVLVAYFVAHIGSDSDVQTRSSSHPGLGLGGFIDNYTSIRSAKIAQATKYLNYVPHLTILSDDKGYLPADSSALPAGTRRLCADIGILPPDKVAVSGDTLSLSPDQMIKPAGKMDLSGDTTGLPADSKNVSAG
jgi:hypothetical protein